MGSTILQAIATLGSICTSLYDTLGSISLFRPHATLGVFYLSLFVRPMRGRVRAPLLRNQMPLPAHSVAVVRE